jgi:5'(3')-deoxyribonucleotidase|tara:strand:- start:16221 stop:16781 length:561 start_codon:yes stop_codon:yes gene_type:complete
MLRKLAVDMDEVLLELLRPMARWKGQKLPTTPKYKYLYREIFTVSEQESQKILHDFYRSRDFYYLKPIEGSQYAMTKLRKQCDKMYILTGRQDIVRDTTENWVDTYFPGLFDDVILTNSFTPNEVKKVDICRSLNIGLIIDDSEDNCLQCIESGMDAINFVGEEVYPWCKESDISLKGWKQKVLNV